MRNRNNRDVADIFEFISIFSRNEKSLIALLLGRNDARKESIYPFELAIEAELSEKEKLPHPVCVIELAVVNESQQRNCHRQIKRSSDFSQMRRGKIEDKLSLW